jgi:hypothetical protein
MQARATPKPYWTLMMRLSWTTVLLSLGHVAPVSPQSTGATAEPAAFSRMRPGGALAPWAPVRLGPTKHSTRYDLVEDGDAPVLHAVADGAASGLAYPASIDLRQTPIMAWRWRIAGLIPDADTRVASREDSPARIVLEFDGDKSKLSAADRILIKVGEHVTGREAPYATLAYIWSNELAVDTVISSPLTRRIQMVVASSGAAGVGVWQSLARDVVADFHRAFGESPGRLLSVGVLTDTDDTGGHAEAWYGDIRLERR